MANPRFFQRLAVLAKLETTYNTDPVPTAAANGILLTNVTLKPMQGKRVERQLIRPFMGSDPALVGGLYMSLSGSVELQTSGAAGTAPKWGVLARACGLSETIVAATSVTYAPISSSYESATVYFYMDGTLYKMSGVRGTAKAKLNAIDVPSIDFDLTGLFQIATDTANVNPTLTGFIDPVLSDSVNTPTTTINAVNVVMRSFELDLGLKVVPRFLMGRDEITITNRAPKISTQFETLPIATFDPFTLAKNRTSIAVNVVHGITAGKIVTLNAPTAQVEMQESFQVQDEIYESPLNITPLPSGANGNNEFSIALT